MAAAADALATPAVSPAAAAIAKALLSSVAHFATPDDVSYITKLADLLIEKQITSKRNTSLIH